MEGKINVGQKAPDFTLPDTDSKPRRLRNFFNKNVVLAFYPGAFITVCTKEMGTFRGSLAKLSDLKSQVVGISVNDPTYSPNPYDRLQVTKHKTFSKILYATLSS